MTAGAGIIHEEYHSTNFSRTGGLMEMVQLWVNLPAKLKMTPPRYQPIVDRDIPAVPIATRRELEEERLLLQPRASPNNADNADNAMDDAAPLAACSDKQQHQGEQHSATFINGSGGSVRVIAGEYGGTTGPARTHSPLNLWDCLLVRGGGDAEADSHAVEDGAAVDLWVPSGHNAMLLVRSGAVDVVSGGGGTGGSSSSSSSSSSGRRRQSRRVRSGEVALFGVAEQPTALRLLVASSPPSSKKRKKSKTKTKAEAEAEGGRKAEVLVLTGVPLGEPIANMGPFVMNTQAELRQAQLDYQSGNFGT